MPPAASPELREKALALLARLEALRQQGGGELPVSDLFQLLGVPNDPELRRQLEARGALELRIGPDNTGAFRNAGPAFTTPLGPVQLQVPRELAGDIRFQDGTVFLDFARDKTLSGKLLLIELRLLRVELSDHHVAIRLPGGALDQVYEF